MASKSQLRPLRIQLLLLVATSVSYADDLRQIIPIFDKPVPARLLSIDDRQVIFVDETGSERCLSFGDFVRWGSLQEPGDIDQLLMVDGTLLIGRITGFTELQVDIETSAFGELRLPRTAIRGAIWQLPTDRLGQWKLRDSLVQEVERDRLLLKNGDVLQGRLLSGERNLLRFESAAGEVELKVDLVAAWQSAGTPLIDSMTAMTIGMRDGTQLAATEVRLTDRLRLKLACGVDLGTSAIVRPVDEQLIQYLRPFSENVVYLSDVESLGHKHIPFLSTTWNWAADRSVVGGPISSYDQLYAKGIGMHSTSRLAFDVPVGCAEFQAEASIDRSAASRGSVIFRVFTTREGERWSEAFKSDIVRGGDEPLFIRVDVRTARRLALVVDFADQADQLDRANWIGARLVKKLGGE